MMRSIAVACSVCVVAGCSTHYQPRPGPGVSVVMEDGSFAYYRNGETIKHGMFGGGLVEAVESDPAAREAAETYEGRMIGGFVAELVGIGCFAAGTGVALSKENDSTRTTFLLGSLGCLLAGSITGAVLFTSAEPYRLDAVNIYNDNKRLGLYPPPYYPPRPLAAPPPAP